MPIRRKQHWYVIDANTGVYMVPRGSQRYGSHGIEFTPSQQLAFVPVLGSSTIEMYSHDRISGHLTHVTSVHSPRGLGVNDGPRHVKIHPNGKILYCVTEHCKFFVNLTPITELLFLPAIQRIS